MDGKANHYARCGQTKAKLQYHIFKFRNENEIPRDSLGLLTMKKKTKNGRGFSTQTLGGFLECFGAKKRAAPPLNLARTCIKQQVLLAGKCYKTL
jgi:hypothetical protein